MSEVRFQSRTCRAEAILDALEADTGVFPFLTSSDGERAYAVDGPDDFDSVLDRIQPDWRSHIARS